ncbi:accessory gene regulator B family protein [Clostridium botulinum]|uniref:Accessory regulator AgrB n=2 Tax=Clostridium botulinum TaxID=1491 RepID=A0A846HV14_CLOBO|nr:accessory gene regulator B family protein [Clostridium botulinum]AJD27757.1 accessory regulator [Clostridium botulinum CDC_297]ACQ53189.1 putative accessory gene regulator protein B [Clostridium botulinum Ba4 str. 657]AJE12475.1 accessory regulator protein [Clostridium botulinum CDC_1436]APQ99202.1 accessory regulator [Clostridium botulinum]APU59237.1 accessory regulator B family protein [Clostridium botulinum]
MINTETISNNIAKKIASELNLDNDKKEVIAYGTFALFQTIFSIFLIIIFGYLFNVQIEALMISFTISILRKPSGGVHATSPNNCAIIGTIICVGFAIIVVFLTSSLINLNILLFLGVIIFVWSYYIIYKLAPVDSKAKPIEKSKKVKKLKKSSIITLSAYSVIILINFVLYYKMMNKKYIIYSLCVYSGIVWQTFTLTQYGHLVVNKLDDFLNYMVDIKKGDKSHEKIK